MKQLVEADKTAHRHVNLLENTLTASSGDLIESYCGSSGPDGVVSSVDGGLYLSFSTDSSRTFDGFSLTYRQILDGKT